jgi:hypothetical protein
MSAQRKSRKLIALTASAVLCLMAIAAYGGYRAAGSHSPVAVSLADTQHGASAHNVTIHACLAAGKLTHLSVTPPAKCPARAIPVQWTVQSGAASPAKPVPSSAPPPSPSRTATSSAPASAPAGPPSSTATPSSPVAQGKACVTTSISGDCGPYDYSAISGSNGYSTYVAQDMWNPISGAFQTLTATGPGTWKVSANMPASNTAVVSYPDTQQIYTTSNNTPEPLSNFSSITSSYAESGPAGSHDDYEAAYDIWASTGSSSNNQEIMIWVDDHGQTPAGSDVAAATIDGAGYKIWSTSGAGAVGKTVSMTLNSNQPSGSVSLLDDLNWLKSHGYMPAGSGLSQVDFGFEICSTGGVAETFTVSQYGIKATCASGSSCTG